MRQIDADYLVVGAGAAGLAFTDALVDHADVSVVLVDRRDGPGGHWRGAYPFVRLHQASSFYGVASTVLGDDRRQTSGPEAGLHERAGQPEILAYDDRVVERLVGTGRVQLFTRCDYVGDGTFVSLDTGERHQVAGRCRVVDARYLSPDIPGESPPRFAVDGVVVVPANDLPRTEARRYVVVGSGKTATDSVVWLLQRGADPDLITWVRPREPWMYDRAVIQPDPVVYLGTVAGVLESASVATSLPRLFASLEDRGTMMRVDPTVTPTMAKTPTLGRWELDLLRTVTDVVRLGHVRAARRDRLELDGGRIALADGTVVVDAAADGLKHPPRVPVWRRDVITLQPVRAGFPCFGAALIGYVEATRADDAEKNELCPPSSYGNSLADWAEMTVLGSRATASFMAEPDIATWANGVAINPARIPPDQPRAAELDGVLARVARATGPGLARLAALAETEPGLG